MSVCESKDCTREARMAIKTTRPTPARLQTTMYYDDRVAPKGAQKVCKECGAEIMRELVEQIVAPDAVPA